MTIKQTDDWHDWLIVEHGDAPLVLSIPHAGTRLTGAIESRLVSPWLARKDADWYVDRLYSFAAELGATVIRTLMSRTVIDVNRDPEGRSLYPGQATTELCPTTTFDGEPLYAGGEPDAREIAARRERYYAPYHAAIAAEIRRLRPARQGRAVRCALDPLGGAAALRRHAARVQPGHELGAELRAGAYACAPGNLQREAVFRPSSTAVSRAATSPDTTVSPDDRVHAVQLSSRCAAMSMSRRPSSARSDWPPSRCAARAAKLVMTLRSGLNAASPMQRLLA